MLEQNQQNDPVNSPEIQEIILSNRIGQIAAELAKRLNIAPERALELFYTSKTCANLHDIPNIRDIFSISILFLS